MAGAAASCSAPRWACSGRSPGCSIGGEGPYAARADAAADPARRVPERMLWLDPTVIGITIMSFMSYWVVGMSAMWLPPYLQVALGYKPYAVGWIISGIFAFQSPLLLAGSALCQGLQRAGCSGRATYGHTSTAALAVSGGALLPPPSPPAALQIVLIAIAFAAPSLTTVFGPGGAGRRRARRAARPARRRDLLGQRARGARLERGDRLGGGAGADAAGRIRRTR